MLKKVVLAIAFMSLAACSALQPKTDEQLAMERAEKRMQALLDLNYEKAYGYMSPGYRAIKNLDRFRADFAGAVNMKSFKVVSAECGEDTCNVLVNRRVDIPMGARGMPRNMEIESGSQQIWVRSEGKWWYVKVR